tara:strand:- start:74 stop:241 length:168 start_codon:yes stop_codon:yes gene_type:complete
MGTEVKKKKSFDAVELQRKLREKLSKKIEGMTVEEELEYFRKASERYKKHKTKRQ